MADNLEGIDTSNIIPRSKRRAAIAAGARPTATTAIKITADDDEEEAEL